MSPRRSTRRSASTSRRRSSAPRIGRFPSSTMVMRRSMSCFRPLGLLLLVALTAAIATPHAGTADAAGDLAVLPDGIVLRGKGSYQQLLVELRAGGSYVGDRTSSAA